MCLANSASFQGNSGVASPKIWGVKVYDFRWITLFLFGKTPLKAQNDYIFQTFWEGMAPLAPLATPMQGNSIFLSFWDFSDQFWFFLTCKYSITRLIRHRLIRQFAEFVTFSSVPAEFLSFVYISVRLIRHRLIRQFTQFVTSFYPLEVFSSANTSLAVSLLMFKQLVRVGIQTN